jgi:xylono-1,5-lactonase
VTVELLADGYQFIEAPRVDSKNNLYFSDVHRGGIFCRSPDGKIKHLIPNRKWIGGIALNADGRIVASGHGGLILLDPANGELEILLDEVDGQPVQAINDIQPDSNGNLYVGLYDLAAQHLIKADIGLPVPLQPLVLLLADRTARRVAEGIKATNGIGISPDGRILYQAETMKGVLAYDRAADGSLYNGRLAIDHSWTDGVAVDSLGHIWIAAIQDSSIIRFTPDGKRDRRIEMPIKEVASLTFGGEDLRDIYVVTGSAIQVPNFKPTGRVYRLRSDVAGQPTPLTRF